MQIRTLKIFLRSLLRRYCLLTFLPFLCQVVQAQNWVSAGSPIQIPADAIVGGDFLGQPAYVCRGGQAEGIGLQLGYYTTVGSNFNVTQGCQIAFGGNAVTTPNFEFLVASWQWASVSTLPSLNPVIGGADGTPGEHFPGSGPALYFCRGSVGDSIQLGKTRPGFLGCLIPFGGKEEPVTSFEVLVKSSPAMPLNIPLGPTAQSGDIPPDSLRSGTDVDGTPLYPCVAEFKGGLHPGKLSSRLGACNFGWGGVEHVNQSYTTIRPMWTSQKTNGPGSFVFDFPSGNDADGAILHVCRAHTQFGVLPGKTRPDWTTCHYAFGGEKESSDYDVISNFAPIIK